MIQEVNRIPLILLPGRTLGIVLGLKGSSQPQVHEVQEVMLADSALLPPGGLGVGSPDSASYFLTFSPICHMSVFLLCFLGDVLHCLLILLFIMFKNVCNAIFNSLELFLIAFLK